MRGYNFTNGNLEFVSATPKILQKFWPPHPESNRQLLRDALIESFGDYGVLNWECKILGISKKGKQLELIGLNNESLGIFDLVIDASGFSSCLRKERIKEDPENLFKRYYTGISMVHGIINDPENSCSSNIVEKIGQGTMITFSKGRILALQRFGAKEEDRRTSLYYMVPCADMNYLSEKFNLPKKTKFVDDDESLTSVKKWLIEDFKAHGDYQTAFNAIDCFAIRPLVQHSLDVEFIDNDLPLIVIGDALHAVPPYTGAGANLALDDANDLAQYLEDKKGKFEISELRAMEKKFLSRTASISKRGYATRDSLISGEKKYLETGKDPGSPMNWLIFFICCFIVNIYRLEILLGFRKNDGRN